MIIQRGWLLAALTAISLTLAPAAATATNVWFGGGAYDGYDRRRIDPGFATGMPQVNNASGATNVVSTNAWLNGMLLFPGSGAPTEVRVYWGTMDGGTNTVSWTEGYHGFGDGYEERDEFTHPVSVASGQTYYYRFYAIDGADNVGWASASASFTTPSIPSLDVSGGVAPLGRSSATLHGELIEGVRADITFYWGEDQEAWSNTNVIGRRAEGPFSVLLSDLTPGAGYAYRVYATNDYGYAYSEVVGFTTRSQTAWFEGGDYDGYDRLADDTGLRSQRGTMFFLR